MCKRQHQHVQVRAELGEEGLTARRRTSSDEVLLLVPPDHPKVKWEIQNPKVTLDAGGNVEMTRLADRGLCLFAGLLRHAKQRGGREHLLTLEHVK